MKKIVLLGALLAGAVAAGHAQESRIDASASFMGVFAPSVYGNGVSPMRTTTTGGFLGSVRYLLTPRSGLELNYSWAQNSIDYSSTSFPYGAVHERQQELSAAYVYSRNYRKFNPFLEGGIAGLLFTPILDNGTHEFDTKQTVAPAGLFGGGVAYELSPSWDLRVEYRGTVQKAPTFGVSSFNSNRYYVISTPAIGFGYHF